MFLAWIYLVMHEFEKS